MRAIALLCAALVLGACTQAQMAANAAHPVVDRYCAQAPLELRQRARLALGTTPAGNVVMVDCVGDVAPVPPPS